MVARHSALSSVFDYYLKNSDHLEKVKMSALHRRNCSVQAGNKVKLSSQSNYISSQLCSPGSSHHAAIQKRTSPNPSSQLGGAGGQPHPVSLIQPSVIACHNEPQNPGPGALVTSTRLFFLKQLGFPNSNSELNLTWLICVFRDVVSVHSSIP